MSLRIGSYDIHSIETGRIRLDGGAMFGVVPKTLWSKKVQADDQNRILLSMRNLVAMDTSSKRVVLVDSGAGQKWTAKEMGIYGFELDGQPVLDFLHSKGLTCRDVTDIVVTHLHFDHNGGLTVESAPGSGQWVPQFPRARHWVHRQHFEYAQKPTPKDRASFLSRDWKAVEESGLFSFVDGESPESAIPGISFFLTHGHTPFQLHPIFHGPEGRLLFCGDVIPTSHHLPVPWIMGYDNQPLILMQEKEEILRQCRDEGLMLAFEHDVNLPGCAVTWDEKARPGVGQRLDL